MFQTQAAPPSVVVDAVFQAAGKWQVVDQGVITVLLRLLVKLVDWNLFAWIMTMATKDQGDFKRVKSSHEKKTT